MEIIIIILLILLNGLFAMSEIALISARRSNLTARAKQGNKAAAKALQLAQDPDRFLSTIQIGITLIGILTGIYSGEALAGRFGAMLASLGMPLRTAVPVAQILIVIVVTYLTIVFGELVPKRIGMKSAERVAILVARPMQVLAQGDRRPSYGCCHAASSLSPACSEYGIRRARSPRRRSNRSFRRGPKTEKCRSSNSRSSAAYSRSATARWVRS